MAKNINESIIYYNNILNFINNNESSYDNLLTNVDGFLEYKELGFPKPDNYDIKIIVKAIKLLREHGLWQT